MIVYARMLAFHEGERRPINIPDDEIEGLCEKEILDLAFKYGQNDFQPVPNICSVSVGDIIELNRKTFLVRPIEFVEVNEKEINEYIALPSCDRRFSPFALGLDLRHFE